ncbi:MAG TPA: hypothetical protein VGL75_05410 [Acidothermaceae bacterium]
MRSAKNNDDVYIGTRVTMGDVKVSLHASDTWRLALTAEEALRRQLGEEDRVFTRWVPPEQIAPGWRRAASIMVPTSSLQPAWNEKPPRRPGRIAFWPAPPLGRALAFEVMIREADAVGLTVNDVIGTAGELSLPSGRGVWVLADEVAADEGWLAGLRNDLGPETVLVNDPTRFDPRENPSALGWGVTDGRVMMLDLGLVVPAAWPTVH